MRSLRTTSPSLGPVCFFSETSLKDCLPLWGLEHLCSLRPLLVSDVRRLKASLCSQTSSSTVIVKIDFGKSYHISSDFIKVL